MQHCLDLGRTPVNISRFSKQQRHYESQLLIIQSCKHKLSLPTQAKSSSDRHRRDNYGAKMNSYVASSRDRDLNAFDVCRVKRLVSEAVEVALTLCNIYLTRVGPSKIFDIVNQIFPTAYVLNTSYWIYYSSEQGHCLCVCAKYGIPCRHSVSYRHWIDLSPVPEDDFKCIYIPQNCFVMPSNYSCEVQVSYQTYDIMIRFTLHHEEDVGELKGETRDMLIQVRYCMARELYVFPETCIMFRPNPQAMPRYGQLIPNLHNRMGNFAECLTSNNVPKFTFIMVSANVHVHPPPRNTTTVAVPVSCDIFTDRLFLNSLFRRTLKTKSTKSTQTFPRSEEITFKRQRVDGEGFLGFEPLRRPHTVTREADSSECVVVKSEPNFHNCQQGADEIIDVETLAENGGCLNEDVKLVEMRKRKVDVSHGNEAYLNELISSFKKPTELQRNYKRGATLDLDTEFQIINEVIEEDLAKSGTGAITVATSCQTD